MIQQEHNNNKTFIVIWNNNERIGSVERTDKNLTDLESQLNINKIQEDITGTVHYEVRGIKRSNRA